MPTSRPPKTSPPAKPSGAALGAAPAATWTPALIAALVVLVVATLVVYARTRGHEFVSLDDPDYVTENPWVARGLSGDGFAWAWTQSHVANWHPLTWLSHMLDVELFGMNAGAHHLVNVGFHVLNTVLLFLALRMMTARPWPSLLVAALFALHPLHVESVAWVTERKAVVSTSFWMGVLLAYAWYVRRPRLARYALVFVLLALGLMAKSMLVTLPLVLLLLDHWPLRRRPEPLILLDKLPLLALSIASCATTVLSQGAGGAVSTFEVMTVAVRFENALASGLRYLTSAVWPRGLACYYPHPAIVSPEGTGTLGIALAAGVVLLTATGFAVQRYRRQPYLLVGWLWYLGTLVPVIGLVQVGEQAMADRYTYVPLIGVFVALAFGLADFVAARPVTKTAVVAGVGAMLVAFTAVTRRQIDHWRGSIPLFEHAVAVTADNYFAHGHLGVEYAEAGDLPAATQQLETAHRIRPYDSNILTNLGIVYAQTGRGDEAIAKFEEALRQRADLPGAHMNLAVSLLDRGEVERAETHFREAIRLKPAFLEAQLALGGILLRREDYAEARVRFEEALRLWTNSVPALYQLGVVQGRLGELDAAAKRFARVLELDPTHAAAHNDLGRVLLLRGDALGAVGSWRRALELDPSLLRTANDLALLLATHPDPAVRNGAEAVQWAEHCTRATQYRDPIPLATLAAAYAEAGRFADAIQSQNQALQLAPAALQPEFRARLERYARGEPFRMEQ